MAADYLLVRCRLCNCCGGDGGWQMKDGFHACRTCGGSGVERDEVTLEDALKDTELFQDLQETVSELLNA